MSEDRPAEERPETIVAQRPPEFDPVRWIKTRLTMQTVAEEGDKWKARFQDKELGEFDSQAEALKAYRKAAEEKFHAGAILPTEEEIDQACPVTVRPHGPPATRPAAAPPPEAQSSRPPGPPPVRPGPPQRRR